MVRLTDRPDMTVAVYLGCEATKQLTTITTSDVCNMTNRQGTNYKRPFGEIINILIIDVEGLPLSSKQ